mgnify:CR=1 FL=1
MTKSLSLICALITTFIWGTAFIAQDTGMDNIGPLTFNAARFLVGFVAILPFALIFEKKKIIDQGFLNHKNVREIWLLHLNGRIDCTARIWSILMFQSWLEANPLRRKFI